MNTCASQNASDAISYMKTIFSYRMKKEYINALFFVWFVTKKVGKSLYQLNFDLPFVLYSVFIQPVAIPL